MRKFRGGFSLIEIMVVVVIIALLAGAVGISVSGYTDRARRTKAKADLATIAGHVNSYYGDHGKYPDPAEGLSALVPDYMPQLIQDPWGGDYQYEMPGNGGDFDVICFGADGREGGEGKNADMTNWTVNDGENTSTE
jgi:general secretion pathway protein G